MFLHEVAGDSLKDRLSLVNKQFLSQAVVTGFPEFWQAEFPDAKVVEDTELLSLDAAAHDLVVHAMSLHWANDPVGQLIQCRRALRPDGLLLVAFLGGQTLFELRAVLSSAEAEVSGGLSPRVAPMPEIRDAGALLQRAGLALPVADAETFVVAYKDMFHLMQDLRAMGETNALSQRIKHPTRRSVFARASTMYHDHYPADDGRILATFETLFLTGWAPSHSQPKPLRPGSAQARLADVLGTSETKLRD